MGVKKYRDRVRLSIKAIEAGYRGNSLEVNTEKVEYHGNRLFNGAWLIYSTTTPGLILEAENLPRLRGKGELAEAQLFRGKVKIGVEHEVSAEEIAVLVKEIAGASDKCEAEVIASYVRVLRAIEYGEAAVEEKAYTDIILAAACRGHALSARIGFIGALNRSQANLLAKIMKDLEERTIIYTRYLKRLSPMDRGRWVIVLRGDAAGALLHELGHCLEALSPCRFEKGVRLHTRLRVYDDPFYYQSPAQRFFDDEAVEAKRRTLVEDGVVIDHLNTRETAFLDNSEPGNAYGLFHRPVPGHSTLVLDTWDWSEKEIIEETRRGILVNQVIEANIDRDKVVTIIPEDAWLIEGGEIKVPIKLSRIRFELKRGIGTIDAISKTRWLRISTEKTAIVAEAAPTVRLQGYVD